MATPTPSIVLDTNAVLDWLVFNDARIGAIATAVEEGRLRWLACGAMREELVGTLRKPGLVQWQPDPSQVLATFDRWVTLLQPPPPAPRSLRCADPDDQVFIDLAMSSGARWLVTRDRALLRLARPASRYGRSIVTPDNWHSEPRQPTASIGSS